MQKALSKYQKINHCPSHVACNKALYSTSCEDLDTTDCFFTSSAYDRCTKEKAKNHLSGENELKNNP